MKKFALAAVAAAAMTGGVAQAYTLGTYSNGFVVPSVEYGAAGLTVVGVINRTGGDAVPVYWSFHGQNSEHLLDGCFKMTNNEFKPLAWGSDGFGLGAENRKGYLVFAVGQGTSCEAGNRQIRNDAKISASSFQISASGGDVSYVPIVEGPLLLEPNHALGLLGPRSLLHVAGAADVVPGVLPKVAMRYAKGQGSSTDIVVWSTGNHAGSHTVFMYDNNQNYFSTNFNLEYSELDHFNPADIMGSPAYVDGFIEWRPYNQAGAISTGDKKADGSQYSDRSDRSTPIALGAGTAGMSVNQAVGAGSPIRVTNSPRNNNQADQVTGSVFVYSVVKMPAYSASQTILGATEP